MRRLADLPQPPDGRLRALLAASEDLLVVVVDDEDTVLEVHTEQPALLVQPAGDLAGRRLQDVLPPAAASALSSAVSDAAGSGGVVTTGYELRLTGGDRRFEARVTPIGPGETLLACRDVTGRMEAEEALARRARTDPLTGLLNRDGLLATLLARPAVGSLAVLFVDLDRFKAVNDALGHDAGDGVLVEVAQRLREAAGDAAVVGRNGSDEFVVLAPGLDAAGALAAAARLVDVVGEPVSLGEHVSAHVGASLGVVLSEDPGEDPVDLLARADLAMYAAKRAGRGRAVLWDEGLAARRRLRREAEVLLRGALADGALVVHYQPVVRLADAAVVGVEALVRWQHPDRGLRPAADFIELVEEIGLAPPLGRFVLERACTEALPLARAGVEVGVNVAPAQLLEPCFAAMVRAALSASSFPAHRLRLEVTESALLDEHEVVLENLRAVRELGCKVDLDDFGTGYASLHYLKHFCFDGLKIDRAFVAGLGQDPRDAAIVHSVEALASALGLTLTVEGVETAEQADALLALGCYRGQGFLFSPAVPSGEVLSRLRRAAP